MTRYVTQPQYCDCYEYHGGTLIERVRRHDGATVWRDWLMFDSVEEASEFFNAAADGEGCRAA